VLSFACGPSEAAFLLAVAPADAACTRTDGACVIMAMPRATASASAGSLAIVPTCSCQRSRYRRARDLKSGGASDMFQTISQAERVDQCGYRPVCCNRMKNVLHCDGIRRTLVQNEPQKI
jgi:hypothetical protein